MMNNKNLLSMILGSVIVLLTVFVPKAQAEEVLIYLSEEPKPSSPAKPTAPSKPAAPTSPVEEETAAKSYERALNFVYDEKWTEAARAFEEHLNKFPKSNTSDAAHYFICYSREHLETSAERSIACILQETPPFRSEIFFSNILFPVEPFTGPRIIILLHLEPSISIPM